MEREEARRRRLRVYVVLAAFALIAVGLVAFRLRPNTRPVLSPPGAPLTVGVAEDASLVAAFNDPDTDRHTVLWQFGDGKTGEGTPIDVAWDQPGEYFVQVMVDDHRGGIARWDAPLSVNVLPVAPVPPRDKNLTAVSAYAEFGSSLRTTTVAADIAFDASSSGVWRWTPNGMGGGNWSTAPDTSRINRWLWDFGDGDTLDNATVDGAAAKHSYLRGGLYFVKLTVFIPDDVGTPGLDETSSASWGVTIRIRD